MAMISQRARRGQVSFHAGQAAEGAVARHYGALGYQLLAERWRGAGGEIDLIVRDADRIVFVEVKKSQTFAAAALRVTPRQMARIHTSASEFLGRLPDGLLTEARFDVALVDGTGAVQLIENAFGGG